MIKLGIDDDEILEHAPGLSFALHVSVRYGVVHGLWELIEMFGVKEAGEAGDQDA